MRYDTYDCFADGPDYSSYDDEPTETEAEEQARLDHYEEIGDAERRGEAPWVDGTDKAADAARRKKAAGNAAAMHEALVQCELFLGHVARHGHPTLNPGDKCTACSGVDELRGMVVRALAAPARNCDRFESWADALRVYLAEHPKMADMNQRAIDACCNMWLFNQAKKGESK